MAEIRATELTPPTAEAAIERAGRPRRWRGFTVGATLATALVVGGGGAVIAGGVLDEKGQSTDIVSADGGTRPPGAGPDIVGAGVVAGKPWKFRAWTEGPTRTCYDEVEKQLFPETMSCEESPGRTAQSKAAERNRFGGGGTTGRVQGQKNLFAAVFQAEVSPDVDHLEVTWKGSKEPVVIRPVQIDPTTRVYVLVVTSHTADPAYDLKAYDAAGKEIKNINL
ncbi:hypothetical protein [Embleya sp. AB8]|uniref:hypothetical protein n=1 Tax=Embleya sp. AB8 TaxID=3156304 RepID=UPI003C77241D